WGSRTASAPRRRPTPASGSAGSGSTPSGSTGTAPPSPGTTLCRATCASSPPTRSATAWSSWNPPRRTPDRPGVSVLAVPDQPGLRLQAVQAVPRQIHQVRRHLGLLRLAHVQPPLAGQRNHADQRLRVQRRQLRVEAAGLELAAQDVLHLGGDV